MLAEDKRLDLVCSKCGEAKDASMFYKSAKKSTGRRSECKACSAARQREIYAENPKRFAVTRAKAKAKNPGAAAAATARYREKNRDKVRADEKAYRDANRDAMRARDRERYALNREKHLAQDAAYRAANPERMRELRIARKAANPERARAVGRESSRKRRATPRGQLENTIRSGLYRGITAGGKAGRSTFQLLGYSLDELMVHLAAQFLPGMTWENYGEWHVDHVIPLSAHNFETPDDIDFKRAWALSNLQPLWAIDNLSKNAKLTAPFQPSLALAA